MQLHILVFSLALQWAEARPRDLDVTGQVTDGDWGSIRDPRFGGFDPAPMEPISPSPGLPPHHREPDRDDKDAPPISSPGRGGDKGIGDYIKVTNKWRKQLSLPDYAVDSSLEAGALRACKTSAARGELTHDALDQVMGEWWDTYERILLSWLCEKPELQGLGEATCQKMVNVPRVGDGSITGHADAIASQSYTKIGCAKYDKYVTCNLH